MLLKKLHHTTNVILTGDKRRLTGDFTIRFRMLFIAALLVAVLVGTATYLVVANAQKAVIEHQARTIAQIISSQAMVGRSVYADHVVNKLEREGTGAHVNYQEERGFVPLPAQFLKLMGEIASNENHDLFRFRVLSKWNLHPDQGLKDDFSRWAWAQLEAQEKNQSNIVRNWQPAWRIEKLQGVRTLRYLRADPASSETCVKCHNAYEKRSEIIAMRKQEGVALGKQWHLNQLIGALEIDIPIEGIERLAFDQRQKVMRWMIVVLVLCLILMAWFVFHDVSRVRSRAYETVSWQAHHDALTGLGNRYEFEHQLVMLLESAKKYNRQHALCYIDLDQFKVVNDTCGHLAGDELLKQLSLLFQSILRETDILVRLGGDEFGVLLKNCPIDHAQEVAEKIIDNLNEFRFVWDDKFFKIGASIGIAMITNRAHSIGDILSAADMSCYAAKEAGRNRIHIFQPDDVEIYRRKGEMKWIAKITRAFEENRFILYSQEIAPISRAGNLPSYEEILIRMHGEDGGLVLPEMFLSAAERYNLMPVIDRWVIKQAFEMIAKTGKLLDPTHKHFSINLSGASINDAAFLEYVRQQFNLSNIPPTLICFEITESVAISNLTEARRFMKELKELGCHFALDDFGSGLSSFGYLKNLPVDYLKIDGSFVKDMATDALDCALVEAINQIGHLMGILTVAEFVSDQIALEKLQQIGVDYAQGYILHQPKIFNPE